MSNVSLITRCVGCGHTRVITEDEIAAEVPMCEKCFSPTVVETATLDDAEGQGRR